MSFKDITYRGYEITYNRDTVIQWPPKWPTECWDRAGKTLPGNLNNVIIFKMISVLATEGKHGFFLLFWKCKWQTYFNILIWPSQTLLIYICPLKGFLKQNYFSNAISLYINYAMGLIMNISIIEHTLKIESFSWYSKHRRVKDAWEVIKVQNSGSIFLFEFNFLPSSLKAYDLSK